MNHVTTSVLNLRKRMEEIGMAIYNVIAESYSGDDRWTHSLVGAFSSLEAAQEYLESRDYCQLGESGMCWEWGWGTSASIVEVPLDDPNMEMPPAGDSCWSVTA